MLKHEDGTTRRKKRFWTDESAHAEIIRIIEKFHCLPPIQQLQQQGLFSVVGHFKKKKIDMSALRIKYSEFCRQDSGMWGRDGLKYKSYPEACFANFMWARHLRYRLGEAYPVEFKNRYGKNAIYDFHIVRENDTVIDVEIFGGSTGHKDSQTYYLQQRSRKEEFNKKNPNFLSIEYGDCYDEVKLKSLLEPFVIVKEPTRFAKAYDKDICSNLWSLADDLIKTVNEMLEHTEGLIPSQHWFDRSGLYKNRPIQTWEPKSWSPFLAKVQGFGGLNKLRSLVGLGDHNRRNWSRADVLVVFRKAYNDFEMSPCALIKIFYNKIKSKSFISSEEKSLYADLNSAVSSSRRVNLFPGKYQQACELAQIKQNE